MWVVVSVGDGDEMLPVPPVIVYWALALIHTVQ